MRSATISAVPACIGAGHDPTHIVSRQRLCRRCLIDPERGQLRVLNAGIPACGAEDHVEFDCLAQQQHDLALDRLSVGMSFRDFQRSERRLIGGIVFQPSLSGATVRPFQTMCPSLFAGDALSSSARTSSNSASTTRGHRSAGTAMHRRAATHVNVPPPHHRPTTSPRSGHALGG